MILVACWMAVSIAPGQSNQAPPVTDNSHPAHIVAATGVPPAVQPKLPVYLASSSVVNKKAGRQYQLVWGIDDILVKQVASGALIRFSYRVLDPAKAKVLSDEKLTPQLVDEASHMALQIPVMEQVGKLRQTASPEAGREYWMVFSNKGGYVSPGNRVSIVIGDFRLDGLIVQ
jgi:hypothetical protein